DEVGVNGLIENQGFCPGCPSADSELLARESEGGKLRPPPPYCRRSITEAGVETAVDGVEKVLEVAQFSVRLAGGGALYQVELVSRAVAETLAVGVSGLLASGVVDVDS
ncbi:hypothetical protein, partial [Thermocatellispora tengchongensis]|uniref:hypothetical protein n=1 Tax=Thermocatellispora tengchongensis TaxID=1073253 RepID=UPI0031E55614